MSTFQFEDESNVDRLIGTLHVPTGTTGQVLTVNADKSISPASGGGSSPIDVVRVPIAFDTPNLSATAYPITGVNQGANTITIAGNHTAAFPGGIGRTFTITGSTGNDGTYTVDSSSFGAGTTSIVTDEAIPDATVDGDANGIVGIVVYTPAEGDILIATAHLSTPFIYTAWDGSTPTGLLFTQGAAVPAGDISIAAAVDMTQADTPVDINSHLLQAGTGFFGGNTQPLRFADTTPLMFTITDGVDGDPGSNQGEGELVLYIARAA